jgi:hypothetical protein
MIDPELVSRFKEAWEKSAWTVTLEFQDAWTAISLARLVQEIQASLGISNREAAAVIFRMAAKEWEVVCPTKTNAK